AVLREPRVAPTGPELVGVPGLCATARTTEPAAEAAECRLSNVRRRALARGEAGDAVQDHGRGRAACVAGEVPGVWVDVGQGTTRAVARSAAAGAGVRAGEHRRDLDAREPDQVGRGSEGR